MVDGDRWWVVLDIFWLVVGAGGRLCVVVGAGGYILSGAGWLWVVDDIFWLVVDGGGWWWMVA